MVAGVVIAAAFVYHWTASDYWPGLNDHVAPEPHDFDIRLGGTNGAVESVRVLWKMRF